MVINFKWLQELENNGHPFLYPYAVITLQVRWIRLRISRAWQIPKGFCEQFIAAIHCRGRNKRRLTGKKTHISSSAKQQVVYFWDLFLFLWHCKPGIAPWWHYRQGLSALWDRLDEKSETPGFIGLLVTIERCNSRILKPFWDFLCCFSYQRESRQGCSEFHFHIFSSPFPELNCHFSINDSCKLAECYLAFFHIGILLAIALRELPVLSSIPLSWVIMWTHLCKSAHHSGVGSRAGKSRSSPLYSCDRNAGIEDHLQCHFWGHTHLDLEDEMKAGNIIVYRILLILHLRSVHSFALEQKNIHKAAVSRAASPVKEETLLMIYYNTSACSYVLHLSWRLMVTKNLIPSPANIYR